jgi:hypothetical protein
MVRGAGGMNCGGTARALGEGARTVCRDEHAGNQAWTELITGRRMDIF